MYFEYGGDESLSGVNHILAGDLGHLEIDISAKEKQGLQWCSYSTTLSLLPSLSLSPPASSLPPASLSPPPTLVSSSLSLSRSLSLLPDIKDVHCGIGWTMDILRRLVQEHFEIADKCIGPVPALFDASRVRHLYPSLTRSAHTMVNVNTKR